MKAPRDHLRFVLGTSLMFLGFMVAFDALGSFNVFPKLLISQSNLILGLLMYVAGAYLDFYGR